ncbi:MAG TPA: cation transporter, partial [Synergistales bacterium]|nr:cation transporter [Synergistales bacterium]
MKRSIVSDETRNKEAKKATWTGFAVNALLTFFKLFAGFRGGSAAMIADGVHSLSDFFTDIVVLVGFKFTEKPADDEHNYGHGKYETLATVVIS